MNGFKTIVAMIVLGVISPDLVKLGLPALTPEQQLRWTAAIVAGAGVLFRTMTNSPVFSSLRAWIAARKAPDVISSVSPEVVRAIAVAVAQEFLKQPVNNQEKTP